jgi:hypothetical protein
MVASVGAINNGINNAGCTVNDVERRVEVVF